MENPIPLIDHAAQQNDRWLFVTLLVVVLFAVWLGFKWLTRDRDKLGNRLSAMTDRNIQQAERLAEIVTNNTLALQNNTQALTQNAVVMKNVEHALILYRRHRMEGGDDLQ